MPMWTNRAAWVTLLFIAAVVLTGCTYKLEGRVVRGDYSSIQIVPKDDPRLDEPGVPSVALHLQTDPNTIKRETVTRNYSGANGEVSIPVDRIGAGFLEYDFGLYARKQGYSPAELLFRLPSGNRRVLITLAPGRDRDVGEDWNIDGDLELYGR